MDPRLREDDGIGDIKNKNNIRESSAIYHPQRLCWSALWEFLASGCLNEVSFRLPPMKLSRVGNQVAHPTS